MPGSSMPATNLWSWISFDKWAHLGVFAILVLLALVGFIKQNRFTILQKHPVLMAMGFSTGYGILMEFTQSLVPQRSFEYDDMAANLMGVVSGYLAFYFIYKI
ncbi:MAG: VanZ family protein [Candidatus Cyclobacteriaceae bacterium M3_2C_046]